MAYPQPCQILLRVIRHGMTDFMHGQASAYYVEGDWRHPETADYMATWLVSSITGPSVANQRRYLPHASNRDIKQERCLS